MDETKVCTKCGERKPIDGFSMRAAASDGRNSHCRQCTHADHQKWLVKQRQLAITPGTTKVCTVCKERKSFDAFYLNKSKCKRCYLDHQRKIAEAWRTAQCADAQPRPVRQADTLPVRGTTIETLCMHRDSCIASVLAAARWWSEATDHEDRDLARQAAVFRARQLVEAQGRCEE